jgi:hypothetical protein
MRESYIEGLATHDGPESCGGTREGVVEALTGVRSGRVLSREIRSSGVPTPLSCAEGNTRPGDRASPGATPRGRRPLACAETPCARTGRSTVRSLKIARRDASGRPEAVIR